MKFPEDLILALQKKAFPSPRRLRRQEAEGTARVTSSSGLALGGETQKEGANGKKVK